MSHLVITWCLCLRPENSPARPHVLLQGARTGSRRSSRSVRIARQGIESLSLGSNVGADIAGDEKYSRES